MKTLVADLERLEVLEADAAADLQSVAAAPRSGAPDAAAHQRVERAVAGRESRVELDEAGRAVGRLERLGQPDLEVRIRADLLSAVDGGNDAAGTSRHGGGCRLGSSTIVSPAPTVITLALPHADRLELDHAAVVAQRLGRRLEDAHDAQAGLAVGNRRLLLLDAGRRTPCSSTAERLAHVQLRRPHVAGAVADAHLVDLLAVLLRIAVERDALVVDLDLLARLEVVVDDHAFAAADQRPPHLHRREPVHVDVRDQVVLELQVQVGDVLRLALDVADARRRHRDRLRRQQVVHDRQVVDGEVPQHADVVLEQAEVHAHRVVVVDLAEAVVDQLAHLADRAGVHEGVVDGQHEAAAIGLVDQALRLLGRRRDRLLDEDVLAGLERPHRQVEVARDRRRDGDRVDARVVQHRAEVAGDLDGRKARLHAGEALRAEIAHRHETRSRRVPEVANEVRTPVAVPDDCNANH